MNAVGDGMFLATNILFFTRVRDFSPGSVSGAMALGGFLALSVGIPVGRFADRHGAKRLLVILTTLEGTAVLSYALTSRFSVFMVAICLAIMANRSAPGIRNAYIAREEPGADRVRLRALLRSLNNVGLAAGSGMAAVILLVSESATSYFVILALDGLSFFVVAAAYARLPAQPPLGHRSQLRGVLRDRPFVLATVSEAGLSIHGALLQIAVPLWVATHTTLPHAIVPALFATSSAICVLAQVPAARGTATTLGAGRAALRSGYLLALSSLLYGLAHGRLSTTMLVALLLAATVVRAAGEVVQTASAWGLSFALAPLPSVGLYQGFFSTGYTGAIIVAPIAWTAVATRHDWLGWPAMAIVFVASGHLARLAASRAEAGQRAALASESEATLSRSASSVFLADLAHPSSASDG